MCSYQPDTLTVRASFSVPSKSDATLPKDNATERESRRRSFRMVGKEALLLKKESQFENLSEEQPDGNIPNGVGFNGESSEVRKQRGFSGSENIKQANNATFDRLVYDTQLPTSNESNFYTSTLTLIMSDSLLLFDFNFSFAESGTSSILIVLLTLSLILIAAFVFLVGRKVYKRRLVKT